MTVTDGLSPDHWDGPLKKRETCKIKTETFFTKHLQVLWLFEIWNMLYLLAYCIHCIPIYENMSMFILLTVQLKTFFLIQGDSTVEFFEYTYGIINVQYCSSASVGLLSLSHKYHSTALLCSLPPIMFSLESHFSECCESRCTLQKHHIF